MPLDLKKALARNKTAWRNFENFANTYQNMYIGWATSAKRPETRKRRIEQIVEKTKENKKIW